MFRTPSRRHLLLLAPDFARVPLSFTKAEFAPRAHQILLAAMQRFRGRIYREDGAISAQDLTPDGRHIQAVDAESWHVLSLERGTLVGCARFRPLPEGGSFQDLTLRNSALAQGDKWGSALRDAINQDVRAARARDFGYAEVGGWALSEEVRCTTEFLRIALATFGLSQALGGYIGISTATRRHCSSSILRRIGGDAFSIGPDPLPPYFDPRYGCEMELLRFDSANPSPRYEDWLATIGRELQNVTVACCTDTSRTSDVLPMSAGQSAFALPALRWPDPTGGLIPKFAE